MKTTYTFCAIATLIFLVLNVSAQEETEDVTHKAPTLQIGLDGISLKKGGLDAQLIVQMVAEAQRHVALKAVQNMFLKKLSKSGGAVYSFADNVIRNVVEEKDTELRTKRIFENTVNIVFTYAFLQYYIETLGSRSKENIFEKMIKHYNPNSYSFPLPYTLKGLKGPSRTDISQFYDNSDQNNLISTLMDMASLAISQDEQLKDLGLMQVSHGASYDYLNQYNRLLIPSNIAIANDVTPVYDDMVACLGNFTKMIGLVKFLVSEKSFRNDQTKVISTLTTNSQIPTSLSSPDLTTPLSTAASGIQTAISTLSSSNADAELKKDILNLTNYVSLLKKAQRILKNMPPTASLKNFDCGVVSDLLYTVYNEIIPSLKKTTFRISTLEGIAGNLNDFTVLIAGYMQANFPGANQIGQRILPFIQLVSRLYEFDRTTTFSEYTKLIAELENVFPNDFAKEALSIISSFVRDHVQFVKNDAGKDVLDFKLESFIKKLQDIKPYNFSPFQFHMTVGVNSGFFKNPLPLDGEKIQNFSFVGEKIGLKFKIFDFDFRQTRSLGETYKIYGTPYIRTAPPTEPLVSNIHLLAFGSGLLYNIINTSTQNNFDGSLAGVGVGLTFSKILDFNASYCLPIVKGVSFNNSFDYSYIGIGFEVQFGSYLDMVSKKKSEKKIEKNAVQLLSREYKN